MKFDLKKKLTLFSSTDKVEMPSLNYKKFFKKNNFSSNINFLNVLKNGDPKLFINFSILFGFMHKNNENSKGSTLLIHFRFLSNPVETVV